MDYTTETRDGYVAACSRCPWVSNLCVNEEDAKLSGDDHMAWHNQQDQAAVEEIPGV